MKCQYPLGFFQNEETLSNALLPLLRVSPNRQPIM